MERYYFILFLFFSIKCLFTDAICPIQYKCDTNKSSISCRKATTEQGVTTIAAKSCPSGQKCDNPTSNVGNCVTKTGIPGDPCKENKECRSGKCQSSLCVGNKLSETCSFSEDCEIGLYCNIQSHACEKQKIESSSCSNVQECKNNLGCLNNICTKFLSLPIGTEIGYVDFKKFCSTNYAVNNGGKIQCAETELTSKFVECEGNVNECEYKADIGTEQFSLTQKCACSYSNLTRIFCPLASKSPDYAEGTKILKEHYDNDAKSLHSTYRNNIKSYEKKKKYTYANLYPALYEAPDCLYEALLEYNSNNTSFIKRSFVALFILIILL